MSQESLEPKAEEKPIEAEGFPPPETLEPIAVTRTPEEDAALKLVRTRLEERAEEEAETDEHDEAQTDEEAEAAEHARASVRRWRTRAVVTGGAGFAGAGTAHAAGLTMGGALAAAGSGIFFAGKALLAGSWWLLKTIALPFYFFYKLKDIPTYLEKVAKGEAIKIPAAKGGGGGGHGGGGHGGGGDHGHGGGGHH